MKLHIDGWQTNLRFSAAHFIPEHDKCSRLHGHDYGIKLSLEGEVKEGILADFGVIKRNMRELIAPLDHKLLLPSRMKYSKYEIKDDYVHISYGEVRMTIPEQFVAFVDTQTTSSEELSVYLGTKLMNALKDEKNVKTLWLSVQEGPGQGAEWSGHFDH
jgi:6-pyruvoyltetrahydropterin/6-carboxytetrahydropterin synthase